MMEVPQVTLLTQEQIAQILRAQGYPVADSDLPEITFRLNALLGEFQDLDARYQFDAEPWPGLIFDEGTGHE